MISRRHLSPVPIGQRRALPQAAGFSLVEVLVTMSIIALSATLIVLTASPRSSEAQEIIRLQNLLQMTAERSRLTGQPAGLVIEGDQYGVAFWTEGEWQMVPRSVRALPVGIAIRKQESSAPDRETAEAPQPVVIFDPLGHSQPVTLELAARNNVSAIVISADGTLEPENEQ